MGAWLGVTATGAVRTTRYGASLDATGNLSEQPVVRNDGEFTLEIRPPTLERFFDRASLKKDKPRHRYKHTIEPDFTFRYVGGVNDFQRFVRFDSDATLSNTSEIEYGITQRLFLKSGDDQPNELVSWRLVQKHYFDPTFGGAIVDGQRNVLQALNSITPFAFALGARNWSPIVSDIKVTPGGKYDAEQILEYDPQLQKITAIGSLIKVKPYSEFFATVAHFRFQADPALQPLSNQVRALFGYGSLNRKGFNATASCKTRSRKSITTAAAAASLWNTDASTSARSARKTSSASPSSSPTLVHLEICVVRKKYFDNNVAHSQRLACVRFLAS